MDQQHFQREYFNQTTINPLGLLILAILAVAMLVVPRRYALWPVLILACFISPAQRVVIVTLDFTFLRLLVCVGAVRLLGRGEVRRLRWNALDVAVIVYTVIRTVTMTMLFGTAAALINRLGGALDILGMYFLTRQLVRDWDDARDLISGAVWMSIPVAAAFIVEKLTARNYFSIFGGVHEITSEREGRLRCQGAFAHPILAGCFWASLMPMIAAMWWWRGGRGRMQAIVGMSMASIIIIACASSTPVIAAACGAFACSFFLVRRYMQFVRWCVLLGAVAAQMAMQAPIWHLLARVDVVGGSTGYYRYRLIEKAIENIDDWWWLGSANGSGAWGQGLFDVTNFYLQQALQGGFVALFAFLAVLWVAFMCVGRMWRSAKGDRATMLFAWSWGACLFVHAMSFIAVSYFGQIVFLWHLHLGVIGSLVVVRRATSVEERPALRIPRVALARLLRRRRYAAGDLPDENVVDLMPNGV